MDTIDEWKQKKMFVEFNDNDEYLLSKLNFVAKCYIVSIVDELYDHWFRYESVRSFFSDDVQIESVKKAQCKFFMQLTEGNYGTSYMESRINVGKVHKKIGLPLSLYMGGYTTYLVKIIPKVDRMYENDTITARNTISALIKLIGLDQELAINAYFTDDE